MNECYCAVDYDLPIIHRVETRKARRTHQCCECGEEILKGERYEHVSGLWDGKWAHFNTCCICRKIREDFGVNAYACLRETLQECLGIDFTSSG